MAQTVEEIKALGDKASAKAVATFERARALIGAIPIMALIEHPEIGFLVQFTTRDLPDAIKEARDWNDDDIPF